MSDIITITNLSKEYPRGGVMVHALQDITLKLTKGDFIVLLGPSGSGKTTLLNVIGSLDKPSSGQVCLDGQNLSQMNEKRLTEVRRKKIGFIFQFYNLLPTLTAIENVELPMIISGTSKREARQRAKELLENVGLSKRFDHRPDELSGGEQQRVAVARALVNHPSIILADEPTGDLDTDTGIQVMKTLKELSKHDETTVIVATHDNNIVSMADRTLRMKDGKIATDEKPVR
jgi:putative ABC transport system ATP-binding protein